MRFHLDMLSTEQSRESNEIATLGPPSMESNNFSLAFVKLFFPQIYSSTLSLGQLRMPSGLSMMNLLGFAKNSLRRVR